MIALKVAICECGVLSLSITVRRMGIANRRKPHGWQTVHRVEYILDAGSWSRASAASRPS